jgi:hypothetical protein
VRYDTLAEIWNTFGFQSLLEVNDEARDHEADRAGCEGIISLRLDTYRKTSDTHSTSKMLTVLQTKAVASQQQIDQLPTARVQPARPFLNCVADYARPLYVK